MLKGDAWVEVLPDEEVSVVERGSLEADENVFRSGFRYGDLFELETAGGEVSLLGWRPTGLYMYACCVFHQWTYG